MTACRNQLLSQIAQSSIVTVDRPVKRQTHGARKHARDVGVQQSRTAAQAKDVDGRRRVGPKTR